MRRTGSRTRSRRRTAALGQKPSARRAKTPSDALPKSNAFAARKRHAAPKLASQQAHEQHLAALKGDEGKKRLKLTVGIVSAVLVISIGVGGYVIKQKADETRKQQLAFAAEQERRDQELKRLKGDFESAQKKQEELQESLSSAKDEATRQKLQAELAQAKADTEKKQTAVRGGGSSSGSSSGASKPKKSSSSNCAPGDPMCGDL